MITGWNPKYRKIMQEFGYKIQDDREAAVMLNSILHRQFSAQKLKKTIQGKPVFVVGSGPSLESALPALKKHKDVIKICADTALSFLVKNRIKPHIIVTDLDGDINLIKKISKTSVVIVHAHGDNITRLEAARDFKNCIGTTQTERVGKIDNFGGFTDGDRCVFLASHFGASKIFLFGMDFGQKIGVHSKTKKSERKTKLKKLEYAKTLLEWLAKKTGSELYALSKPPKGFKRINYKELEIHISS